MDGREQQQLQRPNLGGCNMRSVEGRSVGSAVVRRAVQHLVVGPSWVRSTAVVVTDSMAGWDKSPCSYHIPAVVGAVVVDAVACP